MSHQVENMFSSRGIVPWHQLGKIIPEGKNLSIKEGIDAAGLNWTVKRAPLAIMSKEHMLSVGFKDEQASEFDGLHETVVDRFATVRMSDLSILGNVGKSYEILQNSDAFNWFQPFLDSGQVTLESGGSLFSGQKVWVLAKINGTEELSKGDEVDRYLLLSNSHDGSSSVRISLNPVRVVCANSLSMAHNSKIAQTIRLRHSSQIKKNLDAIKETVDLIKNEFSTTIAQYRKLMNKGVNPGDIRKFVKIVLEVSDEIPEKDLPTRTINRIDEIVGYTKNSPGTAGKTAFDMVQGVTFFTSHHYGRNEENRLDSLWFGQGAKMNERALNLAISLSV